MMGVFGIRKYTIRELSFVTENLLIARAVSHRVVEFADDVFDERLQVTSHYQLFKPMEDYDYKTHGRVELTHHDALGILAWVEYEYGKDRGWEILKAITPNRFVVARYIINKPKFMKSSMHIYVGLKKVYQTISLTTPQYSHAEIRHKSLKLAKKTLEIWNKQEDECAIIEYKKKDIGTKWP